MTRRRSQVSRQRRAAIADAAHRMYILARTHGRSADQLQQDLLRKFADELRTGEARLYAMGWSIRQVREGLHALADEVGLDASGVGDSEIWRWLRGEVRPSVWMDCLCRLFQCHQSQLGWPPQGNEVPVDHTVQAAHVEHHVPRAVNPPSPESSAVSPLPRRNVLVEGGALAMPAINLDDLKHIAAAVRSAPRFADQSVVGLYHRQMLDFASNDGQRGPRKTLPLVLGMIGVIEQTAHEARHTVRRDLLRVAAQTAEFAGWLYRDIGRSEFASYWRDRATEWAQEAGDGVMQGYVLLKKSQAAWDERDAPRMLALSQAVQAGPWQLPARIRAEAAQQEARAYAMLGADLAFVERRLEEGRELLAADTDLRDMDENLNRHYSPAVFAMQSALCYCEAGRPDKAVDIYSAQLSERIFSRRDYGYFLSLKGIALAALGEPDEASRTGLSAMAIANATSSERTMRELVHLVQRLAPWSQWSSVRQLREAVTAL